MIRVAIADDHPELRLALRLLLKMKGDVEVVGEAGNGEEAVNLVKNFQPDVLVMDIQMPVLNGFEATKQIADLAVPTHVILISTYGGAIMAEDAAAVGARGFVSKDHITDWLHTAIEIVHRGEAFFMK